MASAFSQLITESVTAKAFPRFPSSLLLKPSQPGRAFASADLPKSSLLLSRRTVNSAPILFAAASASSMTLPTPNKLQREKIDSGPQESVVLSDGHRMPLLGLGTATANDEQAEAAVKYAIKVGYRHIDSAAMYGNERGCGKGIKGTKREDLYLTTKLANSDHHRVAEAFNESLKKLNTDYVDQYLIHWPVTFSEKNGELNPPIEETWREMEKLVDQGKIRSIGVSNFSVKKLKDLQSKARIQPVINQVEVHAWHRNEPIVDYCNSTGVQVVAYSPAGGLPMYEGVRPWEDTNVREVANKYSKSPFQVLLRWNLQYGSGVIPKSTNQDHIKSNADIWGWQLDKQDYDRLATVKTQLRMCHGKFFLDGKPYKTLNQLWDGEQGNVAD